MTRLVLVADHDGRRPRVPRWMLLAFGIGAALWLAALVVWLEAM